MTALVWDQIGERFYETGVENGVLYLPTNGVYNIGYAWNGLTAITESPSGAEPTPLYADNIKYLNLISVEEFGGTIEAYTYPDEFAACDGTATPSPGVAIGQQNRRPFGLSYKTRLGNDEDGTDYGYKLHLIYNAIAAPSEKAFATINDSPEAITFSWTFTTTAVAVTGMKPTALITIDSTKVAEGNLNALLDALYGTVGADPRLPLPDEVIGMFAGSITLATPTAPTFVSTTGVITIPSITGVVYKRADTNVTVTGTTTVAGTAGDDLIIYAIPAAGFYFPDDVDTDWLFTRTA
jgi:hypothetical protein